MKKIAFITLVSLIAISCKTDKKETETTAETIEEIKETKVNTTTLTENGIGITPISHASMVLNWDNTVIYIDPVGGAEAYANQKQPDIILITDIHEDHLNAETVAAVYQPNTKIIAPQAVKEKLPKDWQDKVSVLDNDQDTNVGNFNIKGIAMYNLREEAKKFHEKGRGNGYVIEKDDKRIYISGDTEDIPEMRSLQNIDIAFVCMNLPYTMTVENAASAVLDFKPTKVYPYHYRGTEGLSNVSKFKALVNEGDASINVVQLDWYPKQ
jgi:L-ascorbate metabolism protein UlaG (beta-lactamase superfamily)